MKKVTVNIEKQKATVDGGTCNFYESGLVPNGIVLVDIDEIKEHLTERLGEDCEISFEGQEIRNPLAYQALISIKDNTKIRVYNDERGLEFVIMLDGDDRSETSNFAVCDFQDKYTSAKFEEYIDDDHIVMTDENGDEYTEWVNGDFLTPLDVESVTDRAKIYL